MKLKHAFIFTLMMLFVITCLLLTDLNAGQDHESWDGPGGRGYASAWSSWNSPIAVACHNYSLTNTTDDPIKYYWTFKSTLKKGKRETSNGDADDGDLNQGEWAGGGSDCELSFNMNGRRRGDYTITAKTTLESKEIDGDPLDSWEAKTTTFFTW